MGAVYTFRVPDGRFGACQALAKRKSGSRTLAEIVTLDYLAAAAPTPAQAGSLAVLRQKWANWDGRPARCNVDERVPWWLERVAVVAQPETFQDECASFGHWRSALGAYHREEWEQGARRIWAHDTTPVSIDLGAGEKVMRRDSSRVSIGTDGMFAVPAHGPPKFDALDALPCLTEVSYTGSDPAFAEYVTSQKIPDVRWHAHGQRTIDFRAGRMTDISIDIGDDPVTLRAPATLLNLNVSGNVGGLTLEAEHLLFPFQLRLHGPRITQPPSGVEGVQCLEYAGLVETDTSNLASFVALTELTLRGAPGKIHDASGLRSLSLLRELEIYEVYELDGQHWPVEWPHLDGALIHGLRKTDAEFIKKALDEVPDVRIAGARTDEWIEANLGNPFREWEADDAAFGRAASAAWKKAKVAATSLGAEAKKTDAEPVLKGLVVTLNRLNAKYDIDTIRREEAGLAFFELARDLGIDDAQSAKWFDDWRDF